MYDLQVHAPKGHPHASGWWTWPFMVEPIWYLNTYVDGVWRSVLFIGNPAVAWGGLLAVAACLWAGIRDRARPLLFAAGGWLFSYGVWAIIPKQIGFLYYYYVPAIVLSLALAGALGHYASRWRSTVPILAFLAVSALLFLYFYPVISAGEMPGPGSIDRWMWFSSWR